MSRLVKQISIPAALLAWLALAAPGLAADTTSSDLVAPGAERGTAPTSPASVAHPRVGSVAPDFTLDTLDGTPHSLHGLRQQGYVLLVFWSTHCPFCQALIPDFKAIDEHYDDKGLTLAAIDIGYEDRPDVQAYVEDHDIGYLVLDDDAQKSTLIKAYGIIGTPTIVLISPQGIVRYYGHHIPDLRHYLQHSPSGPGGKDAAPAKTLPPPTH